MSFNSNVAITVPTTSEMPVIMNTENVPSGKNLNAFYVRFE
jgi:hypothetical protein